MSSAGSYGGSGGGGVGSVLFLTGNSGGPVAPDLTGNINIVGTGAITVVDTPGTHTLTIELTGSVATEYDADTGTAIPVLGILNINGASGIQTTASGNTVIIELAGSGIVESITGDAGGAITGAITITGGSSGAFYTASGGDTLTTTFTKLVMSDSSTTTGFISIGGDKVLSCGPGVASNNIFVGQSAGNATLTGLRNSAVGSTSLASATIAEDNTSVGYATLNELVSGTANVCMGTSSMANATSAGGNTCVGFGTGFNLLTGQLNTMLGYSAGTGYTGAESSNILIGNLGVGGDTNQIRIGTQGSSLGQQNACNIAGIYGSTVGGTNAAVFIDNNGVLGTVGGSGGGVTSITGDTGGPISGVLTITGASTGALFDTTGTTITESFNFLALPDTNNPLTTGYISMGGAAVLAQYGTLGRSNIFTGSFCGNAAITGIQNTGDGSSALLSLTSGGNNTAIGCQAAIGVNTGTDNTAVGFNALSSSTSGSFNIAIGSQAASNYTGAESHNIIIGTLGTAAESNTIRLGDFATQTKCYIAGAYGETVGGTNAVVIIDNTGKLGTTGGSALVGSITGDAGGALTGAITITGGASGAFYTGSGGNTLTTTFTKLVMSDTTATTGYIQIGADIVMAAWGGVANNQIFVGEGSGNATLSGIQNAALGGETLASLTSGGANAAVGYHALTDCTTGSDNVAVGEISLATLTTGSRNVAVGQAALDVLATGSDNIAIGEGAGSNYSGAESSNILIGDSGTLAESNVIRIGTQGSGAGQQNTAYMAGITGSSVGVTNAIVYCDNTGKLGTTGGTFPSLGTTNHAVQVGNSSGGLTSLTVGTNGQVLVGSSGANPVFATLTSTGSSITYTTGAGTLNLDLTSPVSIAHGGTNATSMTTTDGTIYYDGTRLVTTATGTSGQVLTSNGAGVAPTYQSLAGGGVTSLAGDSGGALTGALTLTGGTSGAVFTGAGTTLTMSFNSLKLPDTNGAGTVGVIEINGSNVFALYGGTGNSNLYVGLNAGNATISTTGNAGIGTNTQFINTGGTDNTSVGTFTLAGLTSGNFNTAIGALSLQHVATGGSNTCIGFQSGSSYTAGESGNICVGAPGVAAENNTIHIGDGGTQTSCFIGGIAGVTVASSAAVLINTSTGQLGTVASSRRFKENIDDMGAVSRDLHKLRPVKFNFKGDYNESYGLIAEDVEEIMPHLVSYDSEGLPATVKYHELPALLLNEIQRLKLKIDELEGKVNARLRP